MRLDKFGSELELLLLLTDNNNYTAQELADAMGVSRRNLYYYLAYLRKSGFVVIKQGSFYRLDRTSRFFKRLNNNIVFSQEEAVYLRRILELSNRKDATINSLKNKLDNYYSLEETFSPATLKRIYNNVRNIKEAIEQKSVVRLKGYSSPHSKTVSDRIVEPFMLMNDELDVRCYEIKTGMCKTFKLSRIKSVELIDVFWIHEDKHREVFTDIFRFSGDVKYPVKLRLGQLSYNLLLEEYPQSAAYLSPESGEKHWILDLEVVSFLAVGRFVLGLFHDIEIIESVEFKQYIFKCVAKINEWSTL